MEQVTDIKTKQGTQLLMHNYFYYTGTKVIHNHITALPLQTALISGPASTAKVPQPPTPCNIATNSSPVPLNLCVLNPPSTSQCNLTTPRVPVLLTPSVNSLVSATLQPSTVTENPSKATETSSTSIQSESHESQQGTACKIVMKMNLNDVVKLHSVNFFLWPSYFYILSSPQK